MSAIDDVRQQYAALFASLATALRGKLGTQDSFTPLEMPEAIASIPSGQVTAKLSAPLNSSLHFNTNAENGKFANTIAFTVNSQTYIAYQLKMRNAFSHYYGYWLYPYFDQSNVQQSISAIALSDDGLIQSDALNITYSFKSATDTTDGSIGVNGLGNSLTSNITFEYDAAGNFPLMFDEVTDSYGNIFIKIPKMYRKITTTSNDQITGFRISTSQIDSDYHVYPCFLDEDGNELPYILIGKYCLSDTSTAKSVDASPKTFNIANARTLCRQRGIGYQQYDWMMQRLFIDLCLCISRNIYHYSIFSMLGISHIDHDVHVDGVIYGSNDATSAWYMSYKPSKYENAGGTNSTSLNISESVILSHEYVKASYTCPNHGGSSSVSYNYYITVIGYDSSNEFFNYPRSATSSASSTHYCSAVYTQYRSVCISALIGANSGSKSFGLYNVHTNYWSTNNYARLCYRPISGATGYVEE